MRTTLLLTRPHEQSTAFLAEVADGLGRVPSHLVAPLLTITSLPAQLGDFDLALLTSPHAVIGHETALSGRVVVCVGSQTAAAAQKAGARVVHTAETARDLIAYLRESPPDGEVLYLRGAEVSVDLIGELAKFGIKADQVTVYRQQRKALGGPGQKLLESPGVVLAPVFSQQSGRFLLPEVENCRADVHILAISAAVADVFSSHPHVATAEDATRLAMAKAVIAALRGSDDERA